MAHITLVIVAAVLMLPGIPLTFTPLPSLLYMLLVAASFGFVDGFTHLTAGNFWILTAVFIASIIIDNLAGLLGARYGGASGKSILAGIFGMVIGTIVLPPFGGFIGMFAAVALAEYQNHQNHQRALRAAAGTFIGALAGKIINAFLALGFVILFLILAF